MQLQSLVNLFKKCNICEKRSKEDYAEIVIRYFDSEKNKNDFITVDICKECADKIEDAKQKADSMGDLGEDYREQNFSER